MRVIVSLGISVLFLVVLAFSSDDKLILKPNDERVFIQGRVLEIVKGSVDFAYPGVSFEIKVRAKKVSATLEDVSSNNHNNYFNVVVDGKVVKTLQMSKEKKTYLLVDDLDESVNHTVKLFKRTEALVGTTRFYGFELEEVKAVEIVKKPSKKLLVIGDSFSCGYGNGVELTESDNLNTGFHAENEDNYNAYGAISARKLDFQYQCVAYSGRGMYRNFDLSTTGTVPELFSHVFPDNEHGGDANLKSYLPDVIVINLGTNDFFGESRNPVEEVDSAAFVGTYIAFLNSLEKTYPKANFICIAGGMMSDNWPTGRYTLTKIKTYINEVIAVSNSKTQSTKFHFLEFPNHNTIFGEDWHPTVKWHLTYSDLLTKKIESLNL